MLRLVLPGGIDSLNLRPWVSGGLPESLQPETPPAVSFVESVVGLRYAWTNDEKYAGRGDDIP